jgi:plastocyanin
MKYRRHLLTLSSLALCAGFAVAQSTNTPSPKATTDVTGEVALVQPAGASQAERDASRVVVWLVPADGAQQVHLATHQTHYRLVQRNKHFEPDLLVVPVGSVVDFPNLDPWFHNVFSLYRGKRFDLGLYQAGAQRSVKFDRVGPSFLFCNIHPQMTGVVLAVESDLFAISDKSGRYSIAEVPAGKYVLHVWYENATPESLQALQRTVLIGEDGRSLPLISVATTKEPRAPHKNKYGQDYDADSLKTDY